MFFCETVREKGMSCLRVQADGGGDACGMASEPFIKEELSLNSAGLLSCCDPSLLKDARRFCDRKRGMGAANL
jgi:hypothetical protein